MRRDSVDGIGATVKGLRTLGAALAAALCATAPAHAAVEGALTELTGAGSCLTEKAVGNEDCAPLGGVPNVVASAYIGLPAFSADGRNAYLGTQIPERSSDNGPAMLYALKRDPADRKSTRLNSSH